MSRRGRVYQPVKGRGNPWAYIVDVAPPGAKRLQVRKSGFRTKDEAQGSLNEVLVAQGRHTFAQPNRVTFGGYLTTWLERMGTSGYRATTAESYARHMRCHVLDDPIAGVRLQELSRVDLNRLYGALLASGRVDGQGGLSNRTVRYIHGIIHKALADAVQDNLLARNEASHARPPSPKSAKPPEIRPWTPEELRTFLETVEGDSDYVLWRLYAMTGMRRGEGLGLRWDDIDWNGSSLTVRGCCRLS